MHRHTWGAQHVLGAGSLATLREILGDSTVRVTERYGHLRADLFRPADLLTLTVDLARPTGAVIDLAAHREEVAGNHSAITPVEGAVETACKCRGLFVTPA